MAKTSIGKKFFKLINRHFPNHHKMSKIFNKNTMKLGYSCCRNIGSVIASHNWIIIQPTSNNHGCNRRNRPECPLDNKCLTANILYKAVVSAPIKPEKNFCIVETSFKDRLRNHTSDFRNKNSTELSKCMWKLKDKKITPSLKWNIMSIVHGTPKGGFSGFWNILTTNIYWIRNQSLFVSAVTKINY